MKNGYKFKSLRNPLDVKMKLIKVELRSHSSSLSPHDLLVSGYDELGIAEEVFQFVSAHHDAHLWALTTSDGTCYPQSRVAAALQLENGHRLFKVELRPTDPATSVVMAYNGHRTPIGQTALVGPIQGRIQLAHWIRCDSPSDTSISDINLHAKSDSAHIKRIIARGVATSAGDATALTA